MRSTMSNAQTPSSQGRYVLRVLRRSEMALAARVEFAAFSDPTNTTEDEVGSLTSSDVHPSADRVLTAEERLDQRIQEAYDLYDKGLYTYIGAFLLPADARDVNKIPSGEDELRDSSDLPEGSVLAGSATWQKITSTTAPEAGEKTKKAEKEPTFTNRFFAQM